MFDGGEVIVSPKNGGWSWVALVDGKKVGSGFTFASEADAYERGESCAREHRYDNLVDDGICPFCGSEKWNGQMCPDCGNEKESSMKKRSGVTLKSSAYRKTAEWEHFDSGDINCEYYKIQRDGLTGVVVLTGDSAIMGYEWEIRGPQGPIDGGKCESFEDGMAIVDGKLSGMTASRKTAEWVDYYGEPIVEGDTLEYIDESGEPTGQTVSVIKVKGDDYLTVHDNEFLDTYDLDHDDTELQMVKVSASKTTAVKVAGSLIVEISPFNLNGETAYEGSLCDGEYWFEIYRDGYGWECRVVREAPRDDEWVFGSGSNPNEALQDAVDGMKAMGVNVTASRKTASTFELARQLFVSLIRMDYPYTEYAIQNDGYTVEMLNARSDEDAIGKFLERYPKAFVYDEPKDISNKWASKTADALDDEVEVPIDGEFCEGYVYISFNEPENNLECNVVIDCWGDNGEDYIDEYFFVDADYQPQNIALELISEAEFEYGDDLGIDDYELGMEISRVLPDVLGKSAKKAGAEGVDWWKGCDGNPIYIGDTVVDDSDYWWVAGDYEWTFKGVDPSGNVLLELDGELYDDEYSVSDIGKCIHVASKERFMGKDVTARRRKAKKAVRSEFTPERIEYLKDLAFEYDVPEDVVFMLADMLGPNEDYDGLVTELEDYGYGYFASRKTSSVSGAWESDGKSYWNNYSGHGRANILCDGDVWLGELLDSYDYTLQEVEETDPVKIMDFFDRIMSHIRVDASKSADFWNPSEMEQKLMDIDNDVWDAHGWNNGNQVRENWDVYKSDIEKALADSGVVRSDITRDVIDGLEDNNFHSLIKALGEIGAVAASNRSPRKTAELYDSEWWYDGHWFNSDYGENDAEYIYQITAPHGGDFDGESADGACELAVYEESDGTGGYPEMIYSGNFNSIGEAKVKAFELSERIDMGEDIRYASRKKSTMFDYSVVTEINPSWSGYDKSVAQGQLDTYGEIYVDPYGQPIDNEYDLMDIEQERGVFASRKTATGWVSGHVSVDGKEYTYEAKVYDEGSEYGIDGGRISKLYVIPADAGGWSEPIIEYDRWWGVMPADDTAKKVLEEILAMYPDDGAHVSRKLKRGIVRGGSRTAFNPGAHGAVEKYVTDFHLEAPVNDYWAAYRYLTEDDMTQYLLGDSRIPQSAKDAVLSVEWVLEDEECGQVELYTTREMEQSELDAISSWVRGQNSDGLGEGFEQQDFAEYRDEQYEFDLRYWEDGEPDRRDFDDEEDYEAAVEDWEWEAPNEEDYYIMCSFDWRSNYYKFRKSASRKSASHFDWNEVPGGYGLYEFENGDCIFMMQKPENVGDMYVLDVEKVHGGDTVVDSLEFYDQEGLEEFIESELASGYYARRKRAFVYDWQALPIDGYYVLQNDRYEFFMHEPESPGDSYSLSITPLEDAGWNDDEDGITLHFDSVEKMETYLREEHFSSRKRAFSDLDMTVYDAINALIGYEDFAVEEMDKSVTCRELIERMNAGENVYDILDAGDSMVREYAFSALSEMTGLDYDVFYYAWLRGYKIPVTASKKTAAWDWSRDDGYSGCFTHRDGGLAFVISEPGDGFYDDGYGIQVFDETDDDAMAYGELYDEAGPFASMEEAKSVAENMGGDIGREFV